MKKSVLIKSVAHRLALGAETAAELMTPNVLAVQEDMTVKQAAAFLTTKNVSAAPVLNAAGEPVGVISRADIVKYDYEHVDGPAEVPELPRRGTVITQWSQPTAGNGPPAAADDGTRVRDIMTPMVYSVEPETPASTVVDAMLSLGVHRLFVINSEGNVIGVISALDVVRHLCW